MAIALAWSSHPQQSPTIVDPASSQIVMSPQTPTGLAFRVLTTAGMLQVLVQMAVDLSHASLADLRDHCVLGHVTRASSSFPGGWTCSRPHPSGWAKSSLQPQLANTHLQPLLTHASIPAGHAS